MRSGDKLPPEDAKMYNRHGALLLSFRCNILLFFHPVPLHPRDAADSVKCVVFQKPAALTQRFGMLRRLPSFSGYSMSSK